jgi:cellulose synthase/poly-beta-1,6-N-acetylglucosamine synthase-like glycosyltransferase
VPLPSAAADLATVPSVTIIVPSHNEEEVIAEKLENLAALDYPADRLTLVLALDGCTDNTRGIATAFLARHPQDRRWRLIDYPIKRGKIAVLNECIAGATSDIVALSDASAALAHNGLIVGCRHFAQPDIGVVCGIYRLREANSAGEQAYWSYQIRIKLKESRVAAPMGAHGPFYMVRRDLCAPLPPDTINDDFILPMAIVLQGYRAIYDPDLIITDLERSTDRQDFRRRMRIGAGNLQQLLRLPGLANPARGLLAFTFLSGKGLRAVAPFLLLIAFVASLIAALSGSSFFQWISALEILALVLTGIGILLPPAFVPPPVAWLSYFLIGYAAAAIGALLLLTGDGNRIWEFSIVRKSNPPAEHPAANAPGNSDSC